MIIIAFIYTTCLFISASSSSKCSEYWMPVLLWCQSPAQDQLSASTHLINAFSQCDALLMLKSLRILFYYHGVYKHGLTVGHGALSIIFFFYLQTFSKFGGKNVCLCFVVEELGLWVYLYFSISLSSTVSVCLPNVSAASKLRLASQMYFPRR